MTLEFSRQISVKYLTLNFMKIRSVGAELFHADDGQTHTKQILAFGNFANAPKRHSQVQKKEYTRH
jgi:hypothetical protein